MAKYHLSFEATFSKLSWTRAYESLIQKKSLRFEAKKPYDFDSINKNEPHYL